MDILDPATDFNAKRFYAYVNARKRMVAGYLSIQCRETLKHTRSGTSPIYDAKSDIDILSGVKTHKATGHDEVLTQLWKEAADQLAPIFWAFYRQSHSPCRIANSKRSPNIKELWSRIFCKITDVNLFQGYGTHNPFQYHETVKQAQYTDRRQLLSANNFLKSLINSTQTYTILLYFAKALIKLHVSPIAETPKNLHRWLYHWMEPIISLWPGSDC